MKTIAFFAIRLLMAVLLLETVSLLTSCRHHEEEIQEIEDPDTEPLNTTVWPTDDEVKTTVGKPIAVIGDHFDEVTALLLKRSTGKRYNLSAGATSVPADVQVVYIDTESLEKMDRTLVMAIKEVFQNGAVVYLHKPNAVGALFFWIALFDDIDKAFKETVESRSVSAANGASLYPYDFFAMRRNQSFLVATDIYASGVSYEVEQFNPETNETETVTVTPGEPSAYEYGLFAEDAAEWLNEDEDITRALGETALKSTRAGDEPLNQLDQIPSHKILVPCIATYTKDDNRYINAIVRLWTFSLYSFDCDEDYYHVVMEQEFDASKIYRGKYYEKKSWGYKFKIAGYTYRGPDVFVRWSETAYPLKDLLNPQPRNEGITTTKETVSGWTTGANVGCNNGLVVGLSGSYNFQETVQQQKKEIRISMGINQNCDIRYTSSSDNEYIDRLKQYQDWMKWDYDMDGIYFKGKSGNGEGVYPRGGSPMVSLCYTRQSWNWIVGDTRKRGNEPFRFMAKINFIAQSAASEGDLITRNSVKIVQTNTNKTDPLSIELPVPNRFRKSYTATCTDIADLVEWGLVYNELQHSSTRFKDVTSVTRCAPTEQLLDNELVKEWNAAVQELLNKDLKISELQHTYIVQLKDQNGKAMGRQLTVSAQGLK